MPEASPQVLFRLTNARLSHKEFLVDRKKSQKKKNDLIDQFPACCNGRAGSSCKWCQKNTKQHVLGARTLLGAGLLLVTI